MQIRLGLFVINVIIEFVLPAFQNIKGSMALGDLSAANVLLAIWSGLKSKCFTIIDKNSQAIDFKQKNKY